MRLTRTLFLLLLPTLFACNPIQVIFKTPVESQCGSAGLKGCPELTQGVLLYIQGEEAKGKDALVKGAAENSPEKLKKFAQALKELNKIPGAAAHMKQVMKVADVIAASKGSDEPAAGKGKAAAGKVDAAGGAASGNMTQ